MTVRLHPFQNEVSEKLVDFSEYGLSLKQMHC